MILIVAQIQGLSLNACAESISRNDLMDCECILMNGQIFQLIQVQANGG